MNAAAGPSAPALTGGTSVVGIIGDPVAHSLSPLMHNSAFAALGLDWVYVPFHVENADLPRAMDGLRGLGVRGVNVTIPHKSAVMPLLDRFTESAAAAGAVNTIINKDGQLVGDNTDGVGFVRSLRDEADFVPDNARVLVLGAGGAAKAIAVELARAGARRIVIANRTVERARQLAAHVHDYGAEASAVALDAAVLRDVVADSDLFVQTTPAGMAAAGDAPAPAGDDAALCLPEPFEQHWLHDGLVVADIVYTPLKTPLVRAALEKNCTIAPGWGMLLYQGVEAFERWTGTEAPVTVMRAALKHALRDES